MPKNAAGKAGYANAKHPKFAPLTLDFTFKKAFASEQSKNLLLFLLNTFLKEVLEKPIKDVKIIHTVQLASTREGRGAVFDMQCENSSGDRFIVEMQVGDQGHFIKRTFFYLCMAVTNLVKKGRQEVKGKKKSYDFNYPAVYTLSFLNFELDFGNGCDEVIQYLTLSNKKHPEIRYDFMQMVYVRINRFNKIEAQCKTDLDRLLYSFKNAENLGKKPGSFGKAEFGRLFEIAKITNFNKEELMDYERRMKYYSDYVNSLEYAEEKGVAIGEARGIAVGVERTAKNMLKDGIALARVARITGLPKKQIMALK